MYSNRKNYLLTGGTVPRTTQYRHRKRKKMEKQPVKQTAQNDLCSSWDDADQPVDDQNTREGLEGTLQHEGPSAAFPMLSSSDSDNNEVLFQRSVPQRCKRRKRRKHQKDSLSRSFVPVANDSSSVSDPCSSSPSMASDTSQHSSPSHQSSSPDIGQLFRDYDISEEEASSKNGEASNCNKSAEQLCPCTLITTDNIIFMTMALGHQHGLTWEAQLDILEMIRTIHKDIKLPKAKQTYIKMFFQNKEDILYHVYCDDCHMYIGKQSPSISSVTCNECSKTLLVKCPSNSFLTLSIKSQIETFLKDENFVNHILNHRFKRATTPGVRSDIYDGEVYKKLSQKGGILSLPFNFSYSYFIDGVAYGKSNKTMWPIYLSINELPYEERSKYLILAAVYVNSKDPDQSYFLKPFVEEANLLSGEGISWSYQGKPVISQVVPLCLVADSVARFQILNMQMFHAYYGCTFCYQKAESVKGRARFTVGPPAELRTDASWREDLCEAFKLIHKPDPKDRVVRGVKGSCTLLHLNYFSIKHVVPDYMHAVLQGAVKTHMEFLLDACGSDHMVCMDWIR